MGMEQMKLYRTAGVNPLGGCLPMLLQMPFLLSVYYFIPTAIQLRQSHFLWSNDLSTYDSILNLGFNIPLYGNHVSLFTLLMTISSLLLAVYNKNMTAAPGGNDANAQMMKYMPYIMPIMFLGWFNSMAAGLTFYYTFSNLLSLAQQFIIQKFVINEDKIHAQIQQNKNKPAQTSKWQQRLDEMQKAQQAKLKK
jgi:YidC/Oxa1 family membrane protein insertase